MGFDTFAPQLPLNCPNGRGLFLMHKPSIGIGNVILSVYTPQVMKLGGHVF